MVAIIALLLMVGFMAIRADHMSKQIDKLENKINLQDNNYGKGNSILKQELKDPRIDSLLQLHSIKPKNVQSITNVHYHTHNTIRNDSIVTRTDTSICIDYYYKGWNLHGCNGLYVDNRDFNATGVLHRKPTKHFLFIKYGKVPVLNAWTEYGDTLQMKLIEK